MSAKQHHTAQTTGDSRQPKLGLTNNSEALNNQIFSLLTTAQAHEYERRDTKSQLAKTIGKISAAKVTTRPKSSGTKRFQQVGISKELFNVTAPVKFIKANLDDSAVMRESLVGSAMSRIQGSIPAKHNLLAASMRLKDNSTKGDDQHSRHKSSSTKAHPTKLNVKSSNARKFLN